MPYSIRIRGETCKVPLFRLENAQILRRKKTFIPGHSRSILCGMQETKVVIAVAGVPIGFRLRSKGMLNAIRRRYHGYLPASGYSLVELRVTCTRGYFEHPLDKVAVSGSGSDYRVHRKDFQAEWQGKTGRLHLHESIYAFDACLRIILSILMVEKKGFLLHSSAIALGHKAYIFSGRSEAGKTTIARLSRKKVLNDEIVALRGSEGGRFRVYGTPFWGEMGTGPVYPRPYQARGIHFLRKSQNISKEKLSLETSLPRFLQVVCYFDRRPANTQKILSLAIEVLQKVPSWELFFQKNDGFLKLLD